MIIQADLKKYISEEMTNFLLVNGFTHLKDPVNAKYIKYFYRKTSKSIDYLILSFGDIEDVMLSAEIHIVDIEKDLAKVLDVPYIDDRRVLTFICRNDDTRFDFDFNSAYSKFVDSKDKVEEAIRKMKKSFPYLMEYFETNAEEPLSIVEVLQPVDFFGYSKPNFVVYNSPYSLFFRLAWLFGKAKNPKIKEYYDYIETRIVGEATNEQLKYLLEVIKRLKRLIDGAHRDDLGKLDIPYPKDIIDYYELDKKIEIDKSFISEDVGVELIYNYTLHGMYFIKSENKDFLTSFVVELNKLTKENWVIGLEDDDYSIETLADYTNDKKLIVMSLTEENCYVMTYLCAERGHYGNIYEWETTVQEKAIIAAGKKVKVIGFSNFNVVDLIGFSYFTHEGKKRVFLAADGIEFCNQGSPIDEEKRNSNDLIKAVFEVIYQRIGFTFTEENMNKPMTAIKMI